jgi:folate-binding protein YgfZ
MNDSAPVTLLADRAVLRVAGDDPRGFLQGLLTNDVAGALPVAAALLSPQGKVIVDMIVWGDPAGGDDLLIDVEARVADDLVKRLTRYRLRRALTIARDPALGVHWSPAEGGAEGGERDPRDPALGQRWLGDAAGVDASAAFRAHRLRCGVVEGTAELGVDTTLWLEANARQQHAVDFTKGCYIGQENTARMHYRDKVRRELAVVPIAQAGDTARATYPDLGVAVVSRPLASVTP